MFRFQGLQLFGGGKGGSTVVNQPASVPDATPEERALQQKQLDWANYTYPNAQQLQDMAMSAINNQQVTPNPNWQSLYDTAQAQTSQNQAQMPGLYDSVGAATDQYQNTIANSLNNGYNQEINNMMLRYGDAMSQNQADNAKYSGQYSDALAQNNAQMGQLQQGLLPDAYASNRQAVLNNDLQGTVGNAISNLGSRGILNSSVTNSALNNISQNAANALNSSYLQDLGMQSGLINTGFSNNMTGISNQAGLANTSFGNTMAGLGSQASLYNEAYGNNMTGAANIYNAALQGASSQSQLLNQSQDFAQSPINLAATAQQAAVNIPEQYFSMATGQEAPTNNMWQTMSNQRYSMASPAQTVVTNNGGGLMGGLMSGLGAYYACFVAGTMIATPDGYKTIEEIKVGDKVMSLDDAVETVTYVQEPIISLDDYLAVKGEYGTEVTTTSTQPFITTEGEIFAPNLVGEIALTDFGEELIVSVESADREPVYDLSTTGKNIYFANGFAVKGRE